MQNSPALDTGYSIKMTAELTGISADQLRIWERRYGFPAPSRNEAGVRSYSRKDVDRLRLIARALSSGWRARDAVTANPADLQRLLASAPRDGEVLPNAALSRGKVKQLLERIRHNDVGGAKLLLRQLAASYGPKAFVTDLVAPLVLDVGEAWARGEFEVRHEHLTTELLASQLRLLVSAYDSGAEGSPTVLLATLPHELHTLGLEMTALYLAALGAQPRLLGANSPVEEILRSADELEADVVGISISAAAPFRQTLQQTSVLFRELPATRPLWLGGAGAAAIRDALTGAMSFSDFAALERSVEAWRLQGARERADR